MAGTRFVAAAPEPKLAGLARRLGQVSFPVHATSEVMGGAIEHALAHEPPSAATIASEVAGAERTFGLLRLMLSGGVVEEPDRVAGLPLSSGAGQW